MKILYDLKKNRGNIKGLFVVLFFRLANYVYRLSKWFKPFIVVAIPIMILYKLIVEWVMSIEVSMKTQIGKGFRFEHCMGTVINGNTRIGENCLIRQNVTIGVKKSDNNIYDAPIIGNNVNIGANTVIIGNIIVGDNVIIGSGSVVVKDVPENDIVAGNPAQSIKK